MQSLAPLSPKFKHFLCLDFHPRCKHSQTRRLARFEFCPRVKNYELRPMLCVLGVLGFLRFPLSANLGLDLR